MKLSPICNSTTNVFNFVNCNPLSFRNFQFRDSVQLIRPCARHMQFFVPILRKSPQLLLKLHVISIFLVLQPRPLPSQPSVLAALLVVLVALFLMGFLVQTPTPWPWVNFIKSNHVVVVVSEHSLIVALSAITRLVPLL